MEARSATVWQQLQDIPTVAQCMPGAEILEKVDEHHYKGRVQVKIGPATAAFNGTIEIMFVDSEKRSLRMVGRGADVKGASAATLDLTATVQETETGRCAIVGLSEVTLTGRLANFGGRLINQVSDQILAQFAANFRERLATAPGVSSDSAGATGTTTGSLNALQILWQVVLDWFRSFREPRDRETPVKKDKV